MDDVSANFSSIVSDLPTSPGSLPLRNPKQEAYCWEITLHIPKAEAYRRAGFESSDLHAARGNANKLERRADVRDRIAWLSRQDEDVHSAKRKRIEDYLWYAHEINRADFYETIEEPELRDGKETGKIKRYQRLRPFTDLPPEHLALIEGIKYTDSGRPILETVSKQWANQELRKFLGFGAVARDEGDEYSRLADVELFATLRREAAVLGIDVDLTMRFKGSEAV